jgi:hypothetical protein
MLIHMGGGCEPMTAPVSSQQSASQRKRQPSHASEAQPRVQQHLLILRRALHAAQPTAIHQKAHYMNNAIYKGDREVVLFDL